MSMCQPMALAPCVSFVPGRGKFMLVSPCARAASSLGGSRAGDSGAIAGNGERGAAVTQALSIRLWLRGLPCGQRENRRKGANHALAASSAPSQSS